MSIRKVAAFVRRMAVDLALTASTVELLATPAALIEVHGGRLVVKCTGCRQATRVLVPAELGRIAEVLAARPDPETRTWQAHETVADLERENREHGCPIPIRAHQHDDHDAAAAAQEGGVG